MLLPKQQHLIAIVAILTILFGTIGLTVQQSLRLSANDPQIQLAEDTASALMSGTPLTTPTTGRIDLRTSLAPFIVVYDHAGKVVSGNGYLNNRIPAVPIGVLQAATGKGYSFVTWQPADDVRIAAVSVATPHYYVLAGRNIKEIEQREQRIQLIVGAGWLASLLIVAAGMYYHRWPANLTSKKS